jgi:hypothetical protein
MEFLLLEKLVAVLPISPIDAQGVIKLFRWQRPTQWHG